MKRTAGCDYDGRGKIPFSKVVHREGGGVMKCNAALHKNILVSL